MAYADDYTLFFNTNGATQSQSGANCSVDDLADDDIWFKFEAAGPARIVAGYSTANLTLELFSGAPGNLVSMVCSDNILVLPQLTSGRPAMCACTVGGTRFPRKAASGSSPPSLTANTCVDEACLGLVLLENPSLEQGASCLSGFPSISTTDAISIPIAPGWPQLQFGSADSHSSCEDNEKPADAAVAGIGLSGARVIPCTGKGMAGVYLKDVSDADDNREYIQATLTEVLLSR